MIVPTWDELVPNGQISQFNIESPYQTTPQTDTQFEQGGLSGTKIDTISWDQAFGGDLTLGGFDNQNGLFKLFDNSNDLVIQQDNLGTHYYDTSGHELIRIDNGGLHAFDTSGNKLAEFLSSGAFIYGSGSLQFKQTPSSPVSGFIGADSNNNLVVTGDSHDAYFAGNNVTLISLAGNVNITTSGSLKIQGNNFAIGGNTAIVDLGGGVAGLTCGGGSKTAIVKTSKGYKALYTNESPDVWFMDFAKVKKKPWWKFWKKKDVEVDSLFIEVTSPPYIIIPTMDKSIVQIWGIRKGFEGVRFTQKTETEFRLNNKFWSTPQAEAQVIDKMVNKN